MFAQGNAPDRHGVPSHQPLHLLESGPRQALQTRSAAILFLKASWKMLFAGRKRKVGDFSRMDSRMEETRPEKTANGPTEGGTTTLRNKMVNGLKVPSPSAGPTGGSTASMRDMNLLENIIDWQSVIKKYKAVVKNNS